MSGVRRLSKVDHKKVLREVFIERHVVNAFQATPKEDTKKVVMLAFIIRLVKHCFLHNIVLFLSLFRASPEALGLLLPTIGVQYAIRILEAVFIQYNKVLPARLNTVPKVMDRLQNDVLPIAEEVARFLNLPGIADTIESTSKFLATIDKADKDIMVVGPMAQDLAEFLGKPVVMKSAEKAVKRLSISAGSPISPTKAEQPNVQTVVKHLVQH